MEFAGNASLRSLDPSSPLYPLQLDADVHWNADTGANTIPLDLDLWHRRLAHHHLTDVKSLLHPNLVIGMAIDSKTLPDPICEPCLAGKMHANPFPSSSWRASRPLELVHTNVHDVGHLSMSGYQYCITFMDNYCRFHFVIPLKAKSQAFEAFKTFKAFAENQSEWKIKILRDDNGGEYMNNAFIHFTTQCGILHQHTVQNRPQQNGVAERTNRVLSERITEATQGWYQGQTTTQRLWGEGKRQDSTSLSVNPKRARMGSLLVLDCTLYILEYIWAARGYP